MEQQQSEKWRIEIHEGKGRCLIANQDFEEDSEILVETPLLSFQSSENLGSLSVCQNCLAPIDTLSSQILRISKYDNFIMTSTYINNYELKVLQNKNLPLINHEEQKLSHHGVVQCGNARYCSVACKEKECAKFSENLCKNKIMGDKFYEHAKENQETFLLAAKTILQLYFLIKQNKISEAEQFKKQFDSLCYDYSWRIIAIPDDIPLDEHDNYRNMLKQITQESLNLLLNFMKNENLIENENEIEIQNIPELLQSWSTLEGYGRLLGSFIQNAICITYPNPIAEYLNILADNKNVEIDEEWQKCFNYWYQFCNNDDESDESSDENDDENNVNLGNNNNNNNNKQIDGNNTNKNINNDENNQKINEDISLIATQTSTDNNPKNEINNEMEIISSEQNEIDDNNTNKNINNSEKNQKIYDNISSIANQASTDKNSKNNINNEIEIISSEQTEVTFDSSYNTDIKNVVKQCANSLDPFQGSGIFKILSNINHSCDPNAGIQILDFNDQAALIALKRINKGEEIFISYIDNCDEGYEERQKELQEYKFICDCGRCESDREDMTKKRRIKK